MEEYEEKTEMDAVNSEDLSVNGIWSSQMRESVEVEMKKDDRRRPDSIY
jgi:hypothetical protein